MWQRTHCQQIPDMKGLALGSKTRNLCSSQSWTRLEAFCVKFSSHNRSLSTQWEERQETGVWVWGWTPTFEGFRSKTQYNVYIMTCYLMLSGLLWARLGWKHPPASRMHMTSIHFVTADPPFGSRRVDWLFKRDDVGNSENFLWSHSITPETFSG